MNNNSIRLHCTKQEYQIIVASSVWRSSNCSSSSSKKCFNTKTTNRNRSCVKMIIDVTRYSNILLLLLSFILIIIVSNHIMIPTTTSSSSSATKTRTTITSVEAFHISNYNYQHHHHSYTSSPCHHSNFDLFQRITLSSSSSSSSPSSTFSLQGSSFHHLRVHHHHKNRRTTPLYMFDQLSSAITDAVSNFNGKKKMSDNNIQSALLSVRRALLDADVNIAVTDTLIDGVRKRSLGQELIKGVTADQQFIKAMYDELVDMMGGSSTSTSDAMPYSTVAIGTIQDPAIILLAGLQGAGKTTVAGKLALYMKEREVNYDSIVADAVNNNENLKEKLSNQLSNRLPKRQRNVLIIAADIYRPAAIQQLQVLGERVGVDVYALGTDVNPVNIVQQGIEYAKEKNIYDTIIVDTAGRQVIDQNLMNELKSIKKVTNAIETLLVVDAMTGQEAATLTASFDNAVGITGAILTKMDGDIRGGAAVSVRGVSGKPIKFIGVGEKMIDIEPFYPDRMASRILGMGDIVSLVEKASDSVSDEDALAMQKKMLDASFDFQDFLQQSELVTKMGNLGQIAKMIPGLGGAGGGISNQQIKDVEIRLKKNKALINSMTIKERNNPDLLIIDQSARSRLQRITRGSGLSLSAGQQFISEFQKMRTLMSRMQKQMGNGMGAGMGDDPMSMLSEGNDNGGASGNRASRRAGKKNAKKGTSGARGFG